MFGFVMLVVLLLCSVGDHLTREEGARCFALL